jgi:hypothetical protein
MFITMKFSYAEAYKKFQNDSYLHVMNQIPQMNRWELVESI